MFYIYILYIMDPLNNLIKTNLLNVTEEQFIKFSQKNQTLINSEVEFIAKAINECLIYIETNNCLIKPSEFNKGEMYRGGILQDLDQKTLEPLGKAISKNCGIKDDNEAVWFGTELDESYIKDRLDRLKTEPKYGIKMCKKFNDSCEIDGKNVDLKFINLSDNTSIINCIDDKKVNKPVKRLNKILQTHFNKCLIIILMRRYSTEYTYDNQLIKHINLLNTNKKIIDKQVTGYPCGGDNSVTTIDNIFKAWSFENGTRDSYFNEDRLQITVLFQIIDIFNRIYQNKGKNMEILGWVCDDAPTADNKCQIFHGEFAIAIKYIQRPYNNKIFVNNKVTSLTVYELVVNNGKQELKKINLPKIKKGGTIKRKNRDEEEEVPDIIPQLKKRKNSIGNKSLSISVGENFSVPNVDSNPKSVVSMDVDNDFVPDVLNRIKVKNNDPLNNYEFPEDYDDRVVPDSDINIEKKEQIGAIDEFLFDLNHVITVLKGGDYKGGTRNKKRGITKKKRTSRKRHITRKKHRKYRAF
jgi:hypothetical protein